MKFQKYPVGSSPYEKSGRMWKLQSLPPATCFCRYSVLAATCATDSFCPSAKRQ